jgi:hypothetical protein
VGGSTGEWKLKGSRSSLWSDENSKIEAGGVVQVVEWS